MSENDRTHFEPRKRRGWYRDVDGIMCHTKRYDERNTYTLDFTDALDSGESISSAAYSWDGPTSQAGPTLSSPTIVVDITGAGELEVRATTSASRILERKYRWRSTDTGIDDYT